MTTHDVESGRVLSPRRRDDLLDRLVQVFLAQGFAALGVDDLALRCHCSAATLQALAPDPAYLRRAVVARYAARSADAAEQRVAAVADPQRRPGEYLAGVAAALAPASNAFFRDLERFPAGRQVYESATRRCADRVRELLQDAVRAGRVRDVQASFVADTVTVVTGRISSGALLLSTGLDDARAYAELARLVADGVSG
ncbi:MAG: tetr family transcriptional regulator [Frankiales bacterium]|nr:tetr family transcriptional regulator [Frankiales bacterium]